MGRRPRLPVTYGSSLTGTCAMVITIALFLSVVQASVSPWSSRCYFLRGQTWLPSRPGMIEQHSEFLARILT